MANAGATEGFLPALNLGSRQLRSGGALRAASGAGDGGGRFGVKSEGAGKAEVASFAQELRRFAAEPARPAVAERPGAVEQGRIAEGSEVSQEDGSEDVARAGAVGSDGSADDVDRGESVESADVENAGGRDEVVGSGSEVVRGREGGSEVVLEAEVGGRGDGEEVSGEATAADRGGEGVDETGGKPTEAGVSAKGEGDQAQGGVRRDAAAGDVDFEVVRGGSEEGEVSGRRAAVAGAGAGASGEGGGGDVRVIAADGKSGRAGDGARGEGAGGGGGRDGSRHAVDEAGTDAKAHDVRAGAGGDEVRARGDRGEVVVDGARTAERGESGGRSVQRSVGGDGEALQKTGEGVNARAEDGTGREGEPESDGEGRRPAEAVRVSASRSSEEVGGRGEVAGQSGGRGVAEGGAEARGVALVQPGGEGSKPVQGVKAVVNGGAPAQRGVEGEGTSNADRMLRVAASRGINAALHQRGGALTIRLAPDALGSMTINMTLGPGTVGVELVTSNLDAHDLVMKNLSALKSTLEAKGLGVEKMQATVAPGAQRAGQGESAQQNGGDGQAGRGGEGEQNAAQGQSRGRRDDPSGSGPRLAGEQGDGWSSSEEVTFEGLLDMSLDAVA